MTRRDLPRLRKYYKDCGYVLCEYSAIVKLMWRVHLRPAWTEAAGCLIVTNLIDGAIYFDYPVPGPDGDELAALDAIERWCVETGTPLRISVVPAEKAALLLARYPRTRVRNLRNWRDYVYDAASFRDFPGRHYAGQRNHVNKFRAACPDAAFRVLGKADRPLVEAFFAAYRHGAKQGEKALRDLDLAEKMIGLLGDPHLLWGGMERGGKLLSVAMGERCGETISIHIERALADVPGVYPATAQAFARTFAVDGVRWLNREDDADDKGLRTSKLQYRPAFLAEKYCFEVENELYALSRIPTLQTERLTLAPLRDEDREAYNRLCLDDERNRWWGYDYRTDWHGEPLEDYFLNVTREDFAAHTAVNFGVYLDGAFIGEAVFYRFNGRGEAELGCRIAPEYAGNGYGAEAFAAAADWGLYELQLAAVVAKCYKENAASYRMLSACMRKTGEDGTFFYFRKEV